MAATYRVDVFHGSSPVAAAWVDGGRFHRADTSPTTDGATTYLPVPLTGIAYSWRKHFKVNFLTAPVGSISNLRFFSDGASWGAGITAFAKKDSAYTQGSSADNAAQLSGSVDVTTYTSSVPLTITAGTVLSNPAVGYGTQDYLVMQVGGGPAVAAGSTTPRTLSFRFDET